MSDFPAPLRGVIASLPRSKIREVSSGSLGKPGVIPLWFGEGDEPTPAFICDAATAAMQRGATFYTPNAGIPELRQAISMYMEKLYHRSFPLDCITVSASGMNAIMLGMQVLVGAGDNAVLVEPMWPNAKETVRVMGGEPRTVDLSKGNGGWGLDLDRLFAQCDARTRAIFVNSPNNPTGWMMQADQQRALLDFCRARKIWLVADEVYARIVYEGNHAPSFLEISEPDDPLLVMNSFSKAWSMTGWRLGWIVAPAVLAETLANLSEYNVSHPTSFVQWGGIAALADGEDYIRRLIDGYRAARDLAIDRLSRFSRVGVSSPEAAFYAFFKVDGMTDSLAYCKEILARTGVGLAPGIAFGAAGEGYIRLCFAGSASRLEEALQRLAPMLD